MLQKLYLNQHKSKQNHQMFIICGTFTKNVRQKWYYNSIICIMIGNILFKENLVCAIP